MKTSKPTVVTPRNTKERRSPLLPLLLAALLIISALMLASCDGLLPPPPGNDSDNDTGTDTGSENDSSTDNDTSGSGNGSPTDNDTSGDSTAPGGSNDPDDPEHPGETVFGEWVTVREATCTAEGLMRRTAVGDPSKTEEKTVPKKAHTPEVIPAVPSTCTVKGKTEGSKCSVCETVLTEPTDAPLAEHTPVGDYGKEPTCLEPGYADKLVCAVCAEVLVESSEVPALGHLETVVTGKAPTCTEDGLSDGRYCARCETFIEPQIAIPATGHTPEVIPAIPSTCTAKGKTEGSKCSVCGAIIEPQTETPLAAHTPEVIPAVAPTLTSTGLTEGKLCAVCLLVLVPQEVIPRPDVTDVGRYAGSYGYASLASLPNGDKMRAFYDDIGAAALAFHNDAERNAEVITVQGEEEYYFVTLAYSSRGMTYEEAITAWKVFRDDNPIYYWLSGNILRSSDGSLILIVEKEYASGSARTAVNTALYEAILGHVLLAGENLSAYETALVYHDAIASAAEYAYVPGTNFPKDGADYHSIIGVLLDGEGVCESYAKALQLLLNYSGVENIFVTGIGNGAAHAWNLIRLDDGEWYWCDLTWDDSLSSDGERVYYYFCVSDSQNIYETLDGGYYAPPSYFLDLHVLDEPSAPGMTYAYALPSRSGHAYVGVVEGEKALRDRFVLDDLTYAVSGAGRATLVAVGNAENANVSEKVVYGGRVYVIEAVSAMSGRAFVPGNVVGTVCRSLSLPATVTRISDGAFRPYAEGGKLVGAQFVTLTVSADNMHFVVDGGILYDKEKTVIYSCIGEPATSLEVPETVREVRSYAFIYGSLKELRLPEGVVTIGALAFAHNYYLEEVHLPASLIDMGTYAFIYCGYGAKSSVIYYAGDSVPASWASSNWLANSPASFSVEKLGKRLL